MGEYLAEFQRDGGICQPLVSWTGRNDSQQLFGAGSPLKPAMLVVAAGWAWNGSGSAPTVEIPPGWSNFGFTSNNGASVRSATGIWAKLIFADETPNFFTNHSETAMHFYGFPAPAAFNVMDLTGTASTGDPPAASILRSGGVNAYNGGPCLLASIVAATSTPSGETITFNGGTAGEQLRNTINGSALEGAVRLHYIKRLTTDVTINMGDNGGVNHFSAGVLNLAGVY